MGEQELVRLRPPYTICRSSNGRLKEVAYINNDGSVVPAIKKTYTMRTAYFAPKAECSAVNDIF